MARSVWPFSTLQPPFTSAGTPWFHASSSTRLRLSYGDGMISVASAAKQRFAQVLGHETEWPDLAGGWDFHELGAGEHQRQRRAARFDVCQVVPEQRLAALVLLDAPEIERVRKAHPHVLEFAAQFGMRQIGGREAGTNHAGGRQRPARAGGNEIALLLGQEDDAGGQREEVAEHVEPDVGSSSAVGTRMARSRTSGSPKKLG